LNCSLPTSLMPPAADQVAAWVPPPFVSETVEQLSYLSRSAVVVFNVVLHLGRHFGSLLGFIPDQAGELNIRHIRGKLWLINSIPGLDYPQPLPPLVQYTGPMINTDAMDGVERMPPEVDSFLGSVPPDKPVVYVSYGTVAVLSEDLVRHISAQFTGEDFYVVWALPKSQQNGLPKQLPRNVFVHHWIPTPRILANPKVRVFVSHCGGNSVSESIALGVPIVGYPQFGDQLPNCARLASSGAGIAAKPQSWLRKDHVLKVLQDPTYEQRAKALGRLFKLYGGVNRAADLIEADVRGDLEMLITPPDVSFSSWFFLNGYDLLVFLAVLCSLLPWFVSSFIRHCLAALWTAKRSRAAKAHSA